MGDAVLSAFLQILFQAIAHTVKEELKKSDGLNDKKKGKLLGSMEMIQTVLRESENMKLSELQKKWFGKLKDVSYDAMEVLDEYLYEDHRRQEIHLSRMRNNKVISAANPKRLSFRSRMAAKLEDVATRIEDLLKTAADFQVKVHGCQTSLHTQGSSSSSSHPSSSFPPPDAHHCRREDREHIIKMLLHSDRSHRVQVVPVYGEAYIGKTTVAQLVITDERISGHFELRPWVHVSNDEFNIRRITADIIESIEEGSSPPRSNSQLGSLQRRLETLVRERRYLLVLDDYWQGSWHDWEQLTGPLLSGAPGSKIIVTTRRIGAVAHDLRTSDRLGICDPYELRGLSKQDCWSLFCKYAQCDPGTGALYGSGDSRSSRLIDEVVLKCKGIPFIAASLGHRLQQEKDKSKWAAILWEENLESNQSDYMRSLRMNYAQLGSHLKPCFAYSSILPPNFQFEEEWLIRLWEAQVLIQRFPNPAEMMAAGSNYFRSLVKLSFFQRVHVGHIRERDCYSMPQKMQELALHVSSGDCYILGSDRPCDSPEKVRHLTVQFDKLANVDKMFDEISKYTSLYTLLIIVGGSAQKQLKIPKDVLQNTLKRLRVLDVSSFGLSELPESIGDLIHLRCLQLRGTMIRRLPKSVCHLYHLQTLGLRNCYCLEELPTDIKYLGKLRHIDLHLDDNHHQSTLLKHMPEGIGSLSGLQTLSRFVISKRGRHSSLHELSQLNNLSGELQISNLDLVKDAQEAVQADLASKECLRKLELSWCESENNSKQHDDVQIIENLKPASTITELTISGYSGMACPSWLCSENYMRHLVTVRLYDFKSCDVLPSLGLLPQLKNLYLKSWDQLTSLNYGYGNNVSFSSLKKFHLEEMRSLRQWDWDVLFLFAPRLSELVVKNCPQLRRLPECIQNLQELEDMEIVGCGQLALLPYMAHLTSLQRLEISNCDSIRSLPVLPRSLQVLIINNCHQLSQSCRNLRSTVSSVWIDGIPI